MIWTSSQGYWLCMRTYTGLYYCRYIEILLWARKFSNIPLKGYHLHAPWKLFHLAQADWYTLALHPALMSTAFLWKTLMPCLLRTAMTGFTILVNILGALLSPWRWSVPPKYECLNSCGSWHWDQGQVFWVVQLSFSIWSLSKFMCLMGSILLEDCDKSGLCMAPLRRQLPPPQASGSPILPFVHLLDLMGGGGFSTI